MVLEMVYNVLKMLLALLRREFLSKKKKTVTLVIDHLQTFKKIMSEKLDRKASNDS